MKIYLVQCDICGSKPNKHLIKANNKQDTINYVWEHYYIDENEKIDISRGYELFRKKDLHAIDIETLFANEMMINL